MNWETETFPISIVAGQDHGSYGHYAGTARSDSGREIGTWQLTLRHGVTTPATAIDHALLPVVHTLTVQSRRHAEFLLDAWVAERLAPETEGAA